jgi:FMN phosphatase YigB (HAD superfamily)
MREIERVGRLGVDFDNTIVCYDGLFHRVCRERNLIPADVPVSKSEVRNYLRRVGQEPAWTEMQGYVYGARMSEAEPYPGVLDFFRACRCAKVPVCIISHKTRHPYLGEKYDLHEAALGWLTQQGFFDEAQIALPRENVFLELTKEAKLKRIGESGCTQFIDDLPEFLLDPLFPVGVQRLLFDPNDHYFDGPDYIRKRDWQGIQTTLISNG